MRRVLPGFNLTLGYTLLYLSLIVLIPLSALVFKTFTLSWEQFWAAVASPRVLASYRLTFGAALVAALVNLVFGLLVAWVLVRYSFPGKKIVDALVDLPFALPTAVAGIALTALLAGNGWVGQIFEPYGIQLAFNRTGVVIALIFIGLPFVVRTVQPVLEDTEKELEEAAMCLGATRLQTFGRVILPAILPALALGFLGGFAGAAMGSPGIMIAGVAIGVIATWIMVLRVTVLRLHDLDLSGKWCLLYLLPFPLFFTGSPMAGLIALGVVYLGGGLVLTFKGGAAEGNSYGAPPGPNTLWTLLGALVVVAFSVIAQIKGGDQQKLTDLVAKIQGQGNTEAAQPAEE